MPTSHEDAPFNEYVERIRTKISWASAAWQTEQLEEIKAHLVDLYNADVAKGIDPLESISRAIGTLGDPDTIGCQMHEQWTRDVFKTVTIKTLRNSARISTVLIVLLIAALAIGEGVPPLHSPLKAQWMSLGLILVLAGMCLGWKYERLGGALCLTGVAMFVGVDYASSGSLMKPLMPAIFSLIGLAFLSCSFIDTGQRAKKRIG
jgi:hypothetical protein